MCDIVMRRVREARESKASCFGIRDVRDSVSRNSTIPKESGLCALDEEQIYRVPCKGQPVTGKL